MSRRNPIDVASAMDDATLAKTERNLRREIPVAQALLCAVKRERVRRDRKAKKAAQQSIVVGAQAS